MIVGVNFSFMFWTVAISYMAGLFTFPIGYAFIRSKLKSRTKINSGDTK